LALAACLFIALFAASGVAPSVAQAAVTFSSTDGN
jgi:hypothetical protein